MTYKSFSTLLFLLVFQLSFVNAQSCNLYGVNLAGGDFGETRPGVFGTDYTYPTAQELDYFKQKGITLIRLPFVWERIQRTLGGQLDATELTRIKVFVEAAAARNMVVLLDVHNYCRYKIGEDQFEIGSATVTIDHFKDLWIRLATEFKDYSNIWGYGLMNEPHDLTQASWFDMAQAAIDGIRTTDQSTQIVVGGDSWSSGERWPSFSDDLKNLNDPQDNIRYEAHVYFDDNSSGTYDQSYDDEGATSATGVDRVKPFVDWLKDNNLKGFVGEYGIPGDDERWLTTLDNFLKYISSSGLSGTYWAGGPWWGDYPLSIEPNGSVDKPQMSIIGKYTDKFCMQNAIVNGDFEKGKDSWSIYLGETADASVTV